MTASIYFEQALKAFQNRSAYRGEYCRALYRAALFQNQLQNEAASKALLSEADAVLQTIPTRVHGKEYISDSDFDSLVAIWAQ